MGREKTLIGMLILLAISYPLSDSLAQDLGDPWADSVIAFSPGPGAGFGEPYFPGNVLGPPDSMATSISPSSSPRELLSLGTGGSIILEFIDDIIVDKEGPDFTVFENPFYIGGDTTKSYAETGIVAVSQDGIKFVEFPYDPETLAGLAGVTPTNGSEDPTDPTVSGGDSFDLAEVGLPYARFVKITDADSLVQDSGPSFDLDAVVAIHSSSGYRGGDDKILPGSFLLAQNYPNPFNSSTLIRYRLSAVGRPQTAVTLRVCNILGQEVRTLVDEPQSPGEYTAIWDGKDSLGGELASGVYFCKLEVIDDGLKATRARKLVLIR